MRNTNQKNFFGGALSRRRERSMMWQRGLVGGVRWREKEEKIGEY